MGLAAAGLAVPLVAGLPSPAAAATCPPPATTLNGVGAVSWGDNDYGVVGNGTGMSTSRTQPVPSPVQVNGLTNNISKVSINSYHSLALTRSGGVFSWGLGGLIGDGTSTDRPAPVALAGLSCVVQISVGPAHSLALEGDGTVWAWGSNMYGDLGTGPGPGSLVPVQVPGLTGISQIAAGGRHNLALGADGTVWAWGDNQAGDLGDGTVTEADTPVRVQGLTNVAQLSASESTSYALLADGTVKSWGENSFGQLGIGSTDRSPHTTPVVIPGLTGVTQISTALAAAIALESDGTARAWGENIGALGDGTLTDRSAPAPVVGVSNATQVALGGLGGLALRTDGSLLVWGENLAGQLGDGTTGNGQHTPQVVPGLTNVRAIAAGYSTMLVTRLVPPVVGQPAPPPPTTPAPAPRPTPPHTCPPPPGGPDARPAPQFCT
ncbi:hypothetical protein I6A60_02210 [Frankia sp. AgB1.9]|uniref:RCC1-like domain-containing protein n=1 Tax=unclassified Frankia TaxID=2632575 RepID=UPI001933D9CB|nr:MULTISPECIES: RCC1 domain-containing protein [unclassified Frankia]MBL7492544.1 hypothetical protein [Frankia sp. AgW1.1]MBL7546699.1 hypothetical protein [Frankia sp. AgB1.9]MBL7622857.1 RCC1 repeat- and reductase domain-containing protein [Frankia sp. AgB1.8]